MAVVLGMVAALGLTSFPGIADAAKGKKKQRKKADVTVMSRNLYLGSDLTQALNEAVKLGTPGHQDSYADAVGQVMQNVNQSDFSKRAISLAQEIQNNRPDLVGLQEAALWRVQIPTDGTPLNANSARAVTVAYDFLQQLLDQLNAKAKTKKQCGKIAKKRKAKGKKVKPCYRGYRLVTSQDEFDFESFADFDHDPGPNGKTFDVTGTTGQADFAKWLDGNDDTGVNFGEPPAAQCSDGRDNDGDGLIDYGPNPGNETSGPSLGANGAVVGGLQFPSPPPWGCDSRLDNKETPNAPQADPNGLPQDANFDHSGFAGNFGSADEGTPPCTPGQVTGAGPGLSACPTGVSYDAVGNGLDAGGIFDCTGPPDHLDNSADPGPADGTPGWPFSGVGYAAETVPVCVFHGIDMDIRLTMRDAIIARVGDGVKTSNASGGHFNTHLAFSASGIPIPVDRGFNATDANVRGHKFHFVNTHFEAFDSNATTNPTNKGIVARGKVREAQAQQLLAGPLQSSLPVILVGDLNSNNPPVQQGDELAFNVLTAGGFASRTTTPTSCCYDDITNPNSPGLDHQVDHVMTNNPAITLRQSFQTTTFVSGLWSSDHNGVVSSLDFPGGGKQHGKKKNKKK
jgi:endonuclease/exonuclease/phosphatase family metal-dependent hydrolase